VALEIGIAPRGSGRLERCVIAVGVLRLSRARDLACRYGEDDCGA
jgi:hypothetical protein